MNARMNKRGVTFIEMVLSIVIIGVISVIVTEVFVYSSRSVITGNATRDALQTGRLAIDRMAREIRNVRGNRCVSAAGSTTFTFIDSDDATITYRQVGASLMRNGNILLDRVSNLTFTYYDNMYPPNPIAAPTVCPAPNTCSPACTPTDVWSINIDLTTQVGTETLRLRSSVHPLSF